MDTEAIIVAGLATNIVVLGYMVYRGDKSLIIPLSVCAVVFGAVLLKMSYEVVATGGTQ